MFAAPFTPGPVDEDAAHGRGRHAEEVLSIRELSFRLIADQTQVGFVDQRGSVERLPRPLLRQLLGGELAQLLVDQRQELLGGVRVALFEVGQDAGHVIHGRHQEACHSRRNVPAPLRERVMESLTFVRV